jgi:hypothetical protein
MNDQVDIRGVDEKFDFDNEMSFAEIVEVIKAYLSEMKRKWWVFFLLSLPFVGLEAYKAVNTPVTYKAALTFMVDDEKVGGVGGITAILGNFGFGDSESNLDKVIYLAKSMRIIREALFTKTVIEGKNDYIANHIIVYQSLHSKEWKSADKTLGNVLLNNFLFTKSDLSGFSTIENAALKKLYVLLIGGDESAGIYNVSLDKKSGVMTLNVETRSELLSLEITKAIYEQLSLFYISSSIKKETQTYEVLREKSDSIKGLLSSTEYAAATFKDRNNMLLLNTDQLPSERYTRNKNLYSLMYGESIKNLELADFALKTKTPYIQVIDEPIAPLKARRYSLLKAVVVGAAIGVIISLLFIIINKFIKDALSKGTSNSKKNEY